MPRRQRIAATPSATPDVDLLIRTGGEQRLSDFLLWECAYAELWFTQTAWPDFGAKELAQAMEEFRSANVASVRLRDDGRRAELQFGHAARLKSRPTTATESR